MATPIPDPGGIATPIPVKILLQSDLHAYALFCMSHYGPAGAQESLTSSRHELSVHVTFLRFELILVPNGT